MLEVDVQHHLALAARLRLRAGLFVLAQVERVLGAGQVAGGDGTAYVQGLGGPQQELVVGVGCDRGLQVQGVGEVDVTVDADPAVDTDLGQRDVEVSRLGRGEAFGLGGLGVEPGLGLLDQPPQLRRPDAVRERGDLGVHERRRLRGQAQGAVRDEREPPRRQLPGLEPGPAPLQPVAALHRVGQVAPPGLRRAPESGGELDHRELRHLGAAFAAQRQAGLVPLIDRPDQRLAGVHRRPPGGCLDHLRVRRRPRPASGPARAPAHRRGRLLQRAGAGPRSRSS